MELPNYSCQLLQQLYMLCKERQFCDCTISIGTVYFRAHKLVLAAASLLFKTLLDNTDTISIDASVVSPDEFALLLEMMYTGKLPVGKHNFSKIISLADSLQMFDVAVSCKNLLTSLVSCSGPSQVIRDASPQTMEPCKKDADRLLVENPSPKNVLVSPHSEEVPCLPVALKADTVVVVSAVTQDAGEANPAVEPQELEMSSCAGQDEALEIEAKSAASPVGTSNMPQMRSLSPGKEAVDEEVEEEEAVAAAVYTFQKMTESTTEPEHERKMSKLDFLLQNETIFSEALSAAQDVLKRLDGCRDIQSPHKEAILECLEAKEGISAFKRILSKVRNECLDVETVVSLLELFQDTHPEIKAALQKRDLEDEENMQLKRSTEEGKTLSILLLEHKEDLIKSVTQLRPIREFLETAPGEFLTSVEKEVILNCFEGGTPKETIENLLHRVTEEKTLTAESLVKLLQAVKITFPSLDLLLKDLQKQASVPSTTVQPSPDDFGTELLRRYHENLSEIFTDHEMLLTVISSASSLSSEEREAMEQLVKGDGGRSGFGALVSAVLEGQPLLGRAIWKVLLGAQTAEPGPLNLLMEEMHKEPGADYFFQAVATPESATIEIILRHGKLITEAIQPRAELKCLTPGEERLAEAIKEILSVSCAPASPEASLKAALSRAQEKSLPTVEICRLLCSMHEVFPGLQAVLQELGSLGLLTQDKEPGVPKQWKALEGQEESPAGSPAEPGEGSAKEKEAAIAEELGSSTVPSPRKSFVCAACDKSFHFHCRLKVHAKRCRAARGKQVPCRECGDMKASKKELEKHLQEAHGGAGMPGTPKKKKRRLPVTCDICGREFAHASGMQYHKLTEHFDEKPFSCEECGAKFAANSTLKNHLRLHTGDRPFMCKHCLMTFTQASALAYHTKKKHAEGKMYACQYCDAVFAQSIELSRHVRTHTGDKPYVCRECGKGFRQANGLSIHLRTFHNIDDPYDCKKCRLSFPTLQDHRNHIHEVHSKEYHPCPTCGKIFSAPSLLERHMVTHVRGKPFSCGICDKAYQQLSGLWYHNRTHHPDVFAAQNHRSSKFSALQCSSCDKTFSSTAAHKKHVKAEHADVKFHECETCQELFPTLALLQVHAKCRHSGSQPFRCLYCAASFRFPGALQHHVATEHFRQTENTFPCEVCGELFTSQAQLEAHFESEHGKVVVTEATTQMVQVIQTPEPGASAEQVITLEETPLAGSQVFVTLPDSQTPQASSELVAVTVEDLLDGTVTLICGEAK
ncbi:zinc finger and BTB domain-containing protein 40 [Petaurus breviceps papuanus]|uniref:zinc finger and BTB domain-containing protein 40 n=1 Tax=Petaurus breviceps papuanus TaxID=3040969 RepID=UPI0036DD448D